MHELLQTAVRGHRETSPNETAALHMAAAIAAAIGAARAVNALRPKPNPPRRLVGRFRAGHGQHVHHYVPGVALALTSAGAAFVTANEDL